MSDILHFTYLYPLESPESILDLMTDVAHDYVSKFTRLLRLGTDRELMSLSAGFPVCLSSLLLNNCQIVYTYVQHVFLFTGPLGESHVRNGNGKHKKSSDFLYR